jgi:hypothetical protein
MFFGNTSNESRISGIVMMPDHTKFEAKLPYRLA